MMNWKRILSDAAWAAVRACDTAFQAELRAQPPRTDPSPAAPPSPSPPEPEPTSSAVPVEPPPAPPSTPEAHGDGFFDRVDDMITPIYRAMRSTPAERQKHAQEVIGWFETNLGRLTGETLRILTHNAPGLGEFETIRSLAPAVKAHIGNLIREEHGSADPQGHTQILWGLVLAHEQGLRGDVRGTAAEILTWIDEKRIMNPSVDLSPHGRGLPWLARRSPLITKDGHEPGGAVVWVAHLDWLGAPPANLFAAKAS